MEIKINTDNKIIELEHDINLGDFIKEIEKLLPDWKEYKLVLKTKTITIKEKDYDPFTYPKTPFIPYYRDQFNITCSDDNKKGELVYDNKLIDTKI